MAFITYYTVRLMDIFNVETQRRLQRMEQEQALLREREQIARELHDGIMQTLYGTGLGLKQVIRLAATNPEMAAAMTSELSLEIGRSIVQMRRFVQDLKDDGTTSGEICSEVRTLTNQFEQDASFPVYLHVEGCADKNRRLPAGLREDVLAVVREGLVSAVRQARTKSANVVVSLDGDTFLVRVTLQGSDLKHLGSLALDGLKERIEAAGGLLQILDDENAFSQLVAHLPLSRGARPRGREGVSV